MSATNAFQIAVLPGDGIGAEVMAPALEILRKVEAKSALAFRFTVSGSRRQQLSCHRQVDFRRDAETVRGGRRDPARGLRAAIGALPR